MSQLRILEVGGGAAAYTTHNLAALGEEVIKIEPPGGDPDRTGPPFGSGEIAPGASAHWLYFNANKQSVVLDLQAEADAAAFRRLVGSADVLVDASGPDALAQANCGYDSVLALQPRLVILAQTPFGLTGPRRAYRSNGIVSEAMSGFAYPMGDQSHPPIPSPNEFQLQVAGLHGAAYVLAAMRYAERTGRGQVIDMSLQEVGTHMSVGVATYGAQHTIPRRPRLGYVVAMTMMLPVKDGYVLTQPVFPAMWKAFVEWVGDPELEKPEYATADLRLKVQEEIERIVVPFAQQFTVAEFVAQAQARRIPTGPVNPPAALLTSPQTEALGSLIAMRGPDGREFQAMGYPVRLSQSPMTFRAPAPAVGEHQARVQSAPARTALPMSGPSLPPRSAPLSGIRVLDFTHVLAGPAATQALAFLGAEVIKVETRGAQADTRTPMFASLNRAKKSITLDTRTPGGRDLALDLVQTCDVVVDNFSAGVMDRMGLGYDDLRAVKPDIIAVSINGWGQVGPLSRWSAYGPTLQAYTGLYWTWRHPGAAVHQGIKTPPADYMCAAQALFGTLAALMHRDRTGAGQMVEVIMLEGLAHTLGPYYLEATFGRAASTPGAARFAPSGCYPCRGEDAWCVIACDSEAQWDGLKRALGHPAWSADPRFDTLQQRQAARAELDKQLGAWTAERTAHEAMEALQAEGVPAGVMQTAEDVFNDPHLRARGHIVSVVQPGSDSPLQVEGMTAKFGEGTRLDAVPPPTIGQHNQEVFSTLLGLAPEQIGALEESKAIA